MLNVWKSDIFCFSETWLQPDSIPASYLDIAGYCVDRHDRTLATHGGGLIVYTINDLRVQRRPNLEHSLIECTTLELALNHPDGKHLLFFCYRPLNQPPSVFFNTISELLALAKNEFATIHLLGDYNAKHRSWDKFSPSNVAGIKFFWAPYWIFTFLMCRLPDPFLIWWSF